MVRHIPGCSCSYSITTGLRLLWEDTSSNDPKARQTLQEMLDVLYYVRVVGSLPLGRSHDSVA